MTAEVQQRCNRWYNRDATEVQQRCNRGATEVQQLVQQRCNRDATEVQHRCNRDATEMQQRCNRGATEVQQRCNRGATEVQQRCNNGATTVILAKVPCALNCGGGGGGGGGGVGGGADAVKTCSDCSDGGGGAGAGRAGQDDAGGVRSRQAARPVAAGRRSPARHAVDAAATAPTSCCPGPAPLRLCRSLRPWDGTGRGGLTGGGPPRRRGPGPSCCGLQLGPGPCCSGGQPRPAQRAWAWGEGGRDGRGRGDCGGAPRVVDAWKAAGVRATDLKRDGTRLLCANQGRPVAYVPSRVGTPGSSIYWVLYQISKTL